MKLSLILPVYNGEEHLPETFELLEHALKHDRHTLNVFFVDDGSTDSSYSLIKSFCDIHPNAQCIRSIDNKGKGNAIRLGIEHAKTDSDIIGFTDVDLPYGIDDLHTVCHLIEDGASIVIGNRNLASAEDQYSAYRQITKQLFRIFIPKSVKHIEDTQSGFKFMKASVAPSLFDKIVTDRWVFDIEFLMAGIRSQYNIKEIPVSLRKKAKGRGGIRILKHGPQIAKDLFTIHYYDRKGRYNME